MARWCLYTDRALNDDERLNSGCTDKWGTHHQCESCPHNRYMGDGKAISMKARVERVGRTIKRKVSYDTLHDA